MYILFYVCGLKIKFEITIDQSCVVLYRVIPIKVIFKEYNIYIKNLYITRSNVSEEMFVRLPR